MGRVVVMKKKRRPTGALYAFGRFILAVFCFPVYRLKVIGRENIPEEGPVIVCCNHIAMKDPILLGIGQKRQVFYMAKEELFRNKFVAFILRHLGAFPVRRGTGGEDALQEGYDILNSNGIVGVFIEGHRSPDGELQKPKTGAAVLAYETRATVVPACITAEDGKFCRPFRPSRLEFGPALTAERLAMENDSSAQMRRTSRLIMGEIKKLREKALADFGVAPKEPPEEEGTAHEA